MHGDATTLFSEGGDAEAARSRLIQALNGEDSERRNDFWDQVNPGGVPTELFCTTRASRFDPATNELVYYATVPELLLRVEPREQIFTCGRSI